MPSMVATRSITSLRWRSVKILQDIGGLVKVQMHQNGRHDLRMLIAQQLRHRRRVHPLQALDARDIAALQNAVNQQAPPCRPPARA